MRYPHHLTAAGFSEHGSSRRCFVRIAATKEGPQMKYFRIVLLSATFALVASSSGSAGAQSASVAPQASARANVNGISIMYLDQGQGTAVVLVHGAFFDHRAWEGQREAIVQRYRFIAVTQRYFGTSPWTDNGEKFSVATHVDDLAAFIRGINVGPVHVVGWSYSGPIALALALQYPQLVKSLFVWEPALPTVVTNPEDAKVMAEDRREGASPAIAAAKAGDNVGALRLGFDGVNHQPGLFDMLDPRMRAVMLDNARTIPLQFATPPPQISCAQLGRITAPVAIARGDSTRSSYRIMADTTSRCIPGSRLIVVPGARHAAPVLAAPAFNEALLGFLKEN